MSEDDAKAYEGCGASHNEVPLGSELPQLPQKMTISLLVLLYQLYQTQVLLNKLLVSHTFLVCDDLSSVALVLVPAEASLCDGDLTLPYCHTRIYIHTVHSSSTCPANPSKQEEGVQYPFGMIILKDNTPSLEESWSLTTSAMVVVCVHVQVLLVSM